MNLSEAKSRFEELDVARAMGDITTQEFKEFNELSSQHGFQPDPSWGTFLSSVENAYTDESESFDPSFADKIVSSVESLKKQNETALGAETLVDSSEASRSNTIISLIKHPACGWIAASAALIFALASIKNQPSKDDIKLKPSLTEQRSNILDQGSTLQLTFKNPAGKTIELGDVVWNSSTQEGYMKLSNIKVNDPKKSQYQLWIVDPKRDTRPVDGGVFDLTSDKNTIIPIKATLPIGSPVAFVITEEQPGGVVVSDQKRVIAVAAVKKS